MGRSFGTLDKLIFRLRRSKCFQSRYRYHDPIQEEKDVIVEKSSGEDGIERFAMFSEDYQYRLLLSRCWTGNAKLAKHLPFIMLNPSTASGLIDDPTIRRCMGFARALHYGGIMVVNLFTFRTPSPAELWKAEDPVGIRADDMLMSIIEGTDEMIICGGGAQKHPLVAERLHHFRNILKWPSPHAKKLRCLGVTKDGHPKHPLYIPADTRPEYYNLIS
jgi:hypothetical protein